MSTKQLWIAIAVLVIIAAGIYMLVTRRGGETDSQMSGPTSLQALMALGVPQHCEFTDGTGDTQTTGMVYVAGGKTRGDFDTTVNGQVMHAHTIMKDGFVYSWVDEQGMGMKMAIPQGEVQPGGDNTQFDTQKEMDYDCSAWVPDDSVFETPANITFNEITVPSAAGGTMPAGGAAGTCEQACSSVPEAYRAQCLAAC